jgi:hypothetical protein
MEAENRRVVEINEGIILTGQGQKNPYNGKTSFVFLKG